MKGWTIAPIPAVDHHLNPYHKIAGWTKGHFGLDWRPARDDAANEGEPGVWSITHLGTGGSVAHIGGTFEDAASFVETLEELADWNFTDLAESKSRSSAFLAARDEFRSMPSGRLYRGAQAVLPIFGPAA